MSQTAKDTEEKKKEQEKKARKKLLAIWFFASLGLIVIAIVLGRISNQDILIYITCGVLIVFSLWFVNYWISKFIEDQESTNNTINPYRRIFFNSINSISIILLLIGFFGAFMIYSDPDGNIYQAVALVIMVIWATIFIRYFGWAVYFYNINYGYTDKDWSRIFETQKKKEKGEAYNEKSLNGPAENPYKNETFGLPRGTVRGMIAFTLLFGAIALVIVSMGMDFEVDQNTFIRDSFEFFKTAFLMMIAFYFGDHALKYLEKRWDTPERQLKRLGFKRNEKTGAIQSTSVAEDGPSEDREVLPTQTDVSITHKKQLLHFASAGIDPTENKNGLIPIIDAGHGHVINGEYTTGNAKRYKFLADGNDEEFEILEGVINREIGKRLINHLQKAKIPFHNLTVNVKEDMPLSERVAKANEIYRKNPNTYFLSIHSNAASNSIKGKGAGGKGFEIYTSPGQTKSDELAHKAAIWYMKSFPEFRFRKDMSDDDYDKEAKFYVLRKTIGPAFLVENLFYDNREEAKYLLSHEGQESIAICLFNIVKELYQGAAVPDNMYV